MDAMAKVARRKRLAQQGSGIAADFEDSGVRVAVSGFEVETDGSGLDGVEGVAVQAREVVAHLDAARAGREAVVLDGFGLRGADQVDVLGLLRAQRELALETG